MKRLLYLLMFLIICVSVNASDINILTYRENYRPLETIQAEIIFDKEPINELSNLNFEFYKDEPVGIIIKTEKLSNKRYFAYFNIPDVEKGQYKFKVKNINIIENNILKKISSEKTINVEGINKGFEHLIDNQNADGSFGNIMESSLSALALKNIDNEKANSAISYIIKNMDPTGCYPKGNCNVKDTSFALLALNKFEKNYVKTKNWLKDTSNNFELGTWNLKLEGNANCGDIQVSGSYNLNINSNKINITCNSNVKFILTHNYLGNSHTINEYTGNSFNYTIDDSGCYGVDYKGKCDYISSLYASWALKETNENFPEDYLEENKLDNRTIDHALGYILYHDGYDKDWLLNNYLNGYWSYYSSSISQQPDYLVSSLATYALKDDLLFEEAKNYLNDKTTNNVLESSMILYLLFNDEINLPSISINPGISNKKNNFNLEIKNNKEPINILIQSPNSSNLPSEAYLDDELNYNINAKESFDIIITYGDYSYTIPVISPDEEPSDIPLLPPPKDAIQLVNENIELNLDFDDSLTDELSFTNKWDFALTDVKLNITGRLKEILEFEDDYFEFIDSEETLGTNIYLNKDKNPIYSRYEGFIVITSSKNTLDSIKFTVNFEGKAFPPEEDANETEITDDSETESNEKDSGNGNTKKSNARNLWWLWIIIILIVGVIIFLFFRRKKEVVESFEDYAKKIRK